MSIIGLISRLLTESPPKPLGCPHLEWIPHVEGLRQCKNCNAVARFERVKFLEAGDDPFNWRVLPKEEAIAILNDIQERIKN